MDCKTNQNAMRMKKFICLMFAAIAFSVIANAANWVVTVTTQNKIEFRDSKTNELIGTATEQGRTLTFDIVADTQWDAEKAAISECQGACSTGYSKCVQQNVAYRGHLCNKYVETVPYSSNAKVNTRSSY